MKSELIPNSNPTRRKEESTWHLAVFPHFCTILHVLIAMTEEYAIDAAAHQEDAGSTFSLDPFVMFCHITVGEVSGRISMSRLTHLSRLFQASPKMQMVGSNELDKRKVQRPKVNKKDQNCAVDVPRYNTLPRCISFCL